MRAVRKLIAFLLTALLGAVAGALLLYLVLVSKMPELEWWHREALEGELRAAAFSGDFADYLELERRLFDELAVLIDDRQAPAGVEAGSGATHYNRFLPGSPSNPAGHERNWNQTFVFDTEAPRGGVLLLHGLSDSPYSLRAVGEIFRERGFEVVGLRIPGHGTIPGELARATWRDWRESVRVAAEHLAARIGPAAPFMVVGYSNGGALAVEYTLQAMGESELREPDSLILFAPALGVSPVAAFAKGQRLLAGLLGFEKLAWTAILPEFDPYKYNSFTVFAGEQIYALTSRILLELAEHTVEGTLEEFPPVLVFQSIVDATLPPRLVVEQLMSRLPSNGSAFVLFDLNRLSETSGFVKTVYDDGWRTLARSRALPFDVSFVSNASTRTREIMEHVREAGSPPGPDSWQVRPTELRWARGVFSLSHVAIPFSPDDPIYGLGGDGSDPRDLRLGLLEARGERGVLAVPIEQLMRIRYNPFFRYVEERIAEWIEGAISSPPTP